MSNIKSAVYLIDDESFILWGSSLRSSWDYINDGGGKLTFGKPYLPVNSDKDGEVYLRRDCNAFDGGKMTYESKFKTISGDGFYMAFGSRDDAFLTFYTKGEALYVGDNKLSDLPYGKHYIKAVMDMTNSTAEVWLDSKNIGVVSFDKDAFTYSCLRIGFSEKAKGETGMYFVKLYVNYLFIDYCLNDYTGALPDGYTVKAPKGCEVVSDYRVKDTDQFTYISRNVKGAKTVTRHSFDKSCGKVTLEIKYLMEKSDGKVEIALLKGTKRVISVYDEGENLHCYNGDFLRTHHKNVWQTLRIEADTDKGFATIWLNGKKTKVVTFENASKFIDGFEFVYGAYEKSIVMFSDILVWVKQPEPADYVPRPIVPKKKGDYLVGMNICSLWREGNHVGWDCISPFDDIKPVLGYYEEGHPETADWEIKYMVEHGIDYELYCWYSSESHEPMKSTHLHYALFDGHFYAKYADMEKFALLWEAANCAHPKGLEDFKYNHVPYWLDYFFSDDRYMRVDNKAIMSCFGIWNVINDLGGAENVREGLQYLRDEVKKLGYDDLIIMGCHADPYELKACGFDAHHAYHWGGEGYKLQHNIDCIEKNMAKNAVHIVPTISTGFKNVGWGGGRCPNLSVQDMYKGLKYCIDEVLPKYEKGSWQSKLLHLSTWNEFGEGTYISPTGLNGFGYLDAVRKAVCEDEPHVDLVPNDEQKARIGYLHLQERRLLRRTKYDTRPLPKEDIVVKTYTFKDKSDLDLWEFSNIKDVEIRNGRLCGTWDGGEPNIKLNDVNFDASQIAYFKIKMTNRHKDSNAPQLLGFSVCNNEQDVYCQLQQSWITDMDVAEYKCDLDKFSWWSDTIRGFKIVPIPAGTFEIESITFYASLPHTTLYGKNGRQLFFGDYLEQKNGVTYIPLDPESGIYKNIGMKYEWFKCEGRLEMWNNTNKVTLTVGCPYAVRNGENYTLLRPVYLKDGIPAISIDELEMLFDVKYTRDGDKIYLK